MASDDGESNLDDLDIEELMDVEVVTASRRAEPMTQIPGAITVLDEEDIFRSGATTIPDVLRLVPGIHVAQMDTDKWMVGIRGFSGLLSNKHLVLLDGRPITSPTTASVVWGNSIPISMIKRIEVVRGVWTHLWGADSFTGVINIITKTAAETKGGQSVTLAGTSGLEQILRYGGNIGDTVDYRAYVGGAYKMNGWTTGAEDNQSSKDWSREQFGFRADWENIFTDSFSIQGNIGASSIDDDAFGSRQIYNPHAREDYNGYGQLVWNRATGLDSGITFRTSYARDQISVADLTGGTSVIDAEVQHAVEQMGRHRLLWGIGSRYYWDDIESGSRVSIDKDNRYTFTSNGFVQDRITLYDDLFLTLGAKLDYFNEDSPIEIQPSARLLYTRENDEFWLGVSRAVRADTRWQQSGSYSINKGGNVYTLNTPDGLTTEKLIAYEAGYRSRVSQDAEFDLSLYINDYSELVMFEFDRVTRTAKLSNTLTGTAYGVEASLDWRLNSWVTLRPTTGFVYQNVYGVETPEGESMPDEGMMADFSLQVMTQPTQNIGLDFLVGYVDGPMDQNVPGYLTLEGHASWKASDTLLFELLARNMGEAIDQSSNLRIGPSADLRVTWDF